MNYGPLTAHCPICGKLFVTMWQEFWTYRRGATFYCSENCLQIDLTRDLNMLNEARKKRKDRFTMTKLKKDGTPAKKPGPKKKDVIAQVKVDGALKIETPEAEKIEIVETPEVQPMTYDGMEVSALRHPDLGEFYFDKKYNSIDWRTPEGDEISLGPAWWKQLVTDLPKIMKLLGVEL